MRDRATLNSAPFRAVRPLLAVACFLAGFSNPVKASAEPLESLLRAEQPSALASAARSEGDPVKGAFLFHRSSLTCAACHSVGNEVNTRGPNLATLDKTVTDEALVESILEPSKTIAKGYVTVVVHTVDGKVVTGLPVEETAEYLVLRDAAQPDQTVRFEKNDIEERHETNQSIMPAGQANLLGNRRQFLNLVRYLIELRDGGEPRARQLQPPALSALALAPSDRPVVQRGEVAVTPKDRFPRAVSIGFADGTVMFDADRLGTAALWFDGFVKSSAQNYFGLYWHRQGGEPDMMPLEAHPLRFQMPPSEKWQAFEPPPASDPNTGSRFDGYQTGESTVRLHYRVLVGGVRIGVVEDVRLEKRGHWHGLARAFRFDGLPAGARVALSLPPGEHFDFFDATGQKQSDPARAAKTSLLGYQNGGAFAVVRAPLDGGTTWLPSENQIPWRVASAPAQADQSLTLRVDLWKYRGGKDGPTPTELADLEAKPPRLATDEFDAAKQKPKPPQEPVAQSSEPKKPAAVRAEVTPGYLMESIPLPFDGCRVADVAFADDGTLYVIAMTEGQVWRTQTPPVGSPDAVHWKRYAAGLFHPTGLAVVDGRVFVAQKPEITELVDRDGDGVVDQYRTVATGWGLSLGWHEYCFGLVTDAQKNLWFALNTGNFWTHAGFVNPGRWRGSIMRIDHGTEKLEEVAKGLRVPNGIARGPNGDIFFTDNQGDWIQSCKLACVTPKRFYGHPESKTDALPAETFPNGLSAVWLPYEHSRSTSGPVYDSTGGKFGPFADQMFVGDVGYGTNTGIMRIALERVDGEYQGACFRFVKDQPLGCQRMTFGPDHALYMASLSSGLERLIPTGKVPFAIHSLRIQPEDKGFTVTFTKPLAADAKVDPAMCRVKRYHYVYSGAYGSPKAGEQEVLVQSVEVSNDRKTLTMKFPVETHPLGMVYEFTFAPLMAEDGDRLSHGEAWYTVHKIPRHEGKGREAPLGQ